MEVPRSLQQESRLTQCCEDSHSASQHSASTACSDASDSYSEGSPNVVSELHCIHKSTVFVFD